MCNGGDSRECVSVDVASTLRPTILNLLCPSNLALPPLGHHHLDVLPAMPNLIPCALPSCDSPPDPHLDVLPNMRVDNEANALGGHQVHAALHHVNLCSSEEEVQMERMDEENSRGGGEEEMKAM